MVDSVSGFRPHSGSRRRAAFDLQSLSRRLFSLNEPLPSHPPFLVSSGLRLVSALRRGIGDRPPDGDSSSWEQLLSCRQGAGADGFLVWPLPEAGSSVEDPVLDRAVEIRALVDSLREHQGRHHTQPLDCFLRKEALRIRRVPLESESLPVVVRLGSWYVVVPVGDEHPRQLRDNIVRAFERGPRSLGHLRLRQVSAPLVVSLLPVSFAESVHLHRWGLEGPWLSWSHAGGLHQIGVLAAHPLVLEGPGFACLRVDFRRRLRAMRVALGLNASEPQWDGREDFGPRDAMPFPVQPLGVQEALDPAWDAAFDELLEQSCSESGAPSLRQSHGSHVLVEGAAPDTRPLLPPALLGLCDDEHWRWLHPGRWTGGGLRSPTLRYATVDRTGFSLVATCYSYCCAQHRVMQEFDPSYRGQGFTFVVPYIAGSDAFAGESRRRPRPVLCSLHAKRGVPESFESFQRRLERRLEEAERDDDLLSHVIGDLFQVAVPEWLRSAAVNLFSRAPGDRGTFLGGRGLVCYSQVPDEAVDPVASYGGIYEGLFSGSCQERGGVVLSIIDRGYRRDLCAVGTGIFRQEHTMDLFWQSFAEMYSEQ